MFDSPSGLSTPHVRETTANPKTYMVSARQGKFKALRGQAIAAAHRSADFRPYLSPELLCRGGSAW
jgi:hypothetical protein